MWPHQKRAVTGTLDLIKQGWRRILVVTGTGGGKTLDMAELAKHYQRERVALYTNRKMLLGQMSRAFTGLGVQHGVRAAGYMPDEEAPLQIISVQTENQRTMKKQTQAIHSAGLVMIDEAHVMKGPTVKAILDQHMTDGAAIVGFTATPIDLEEWYDKLVMAGTPSELRACGAIVPARHYGPDEPDMDALKRAKKVKAGEGDDLSHREQRSAMMTPTIFARVGVWFDKLNPDRVPTILFAPGVPESLWFAEQFWKKGITAAHIDGDRIWVNGEDLPMKTDEQKRYSRDKVVAMSKSGEVTALCNRFVMREGIDCPWLRHVIVATVFGSLQSYIQSLGRGGRADRDPVTNAKWGPKEYFVVQDHGGNWLRHGSINADRHWDLSYTAGTVYGLRAERLRDKKEKEPRRCPVCGLIYMDKCPLGHDPGPRKSRPVVAMDGSLREMAGDCFVPRREYKKPDGQALWEKMFWRSRTERGDRSFRAAMALFAHENHGLFPSKDWKYMPTREIDLFRKCRAVELNRLRGLEHLPDGAGRKDITERTADE